MLKRSLSSLVLILLCLFSLHSPASACVGRILYVGAQNTIEDRVLAEMLVLLINERTGTTVKIRLFDDNAQLYQALKAESEEERVDIIVEDTADAFAVLQETLANGNSDQQYLTAKNRYEKELDVIWLNPFGFTNNKGDTVSTVSAPLVRRDVLTNFPLLPRVLNKLAGAIDDKSFSELTGSAKAGEKPKNVAKDFLRVKKFI